MVRLLGPTAISNASGEVTLGGRREQALLALLAARLGHVVPTDVLVEQVWEEKERPRTVRSALRVHLTRLRRALGDGSNNPVPHRGDGYLLEPAYVTTDAHLLSDLLHRARAARTAGDHAAAVIMLGDALALRRGLPLVGLHDMPVLREYAEDLMEQLLAAEEELLDARLAVGDHAAACSTAATLVARAPFRERRTSLLTIALYRSGRQADALAACARLRAVLAEELGVDPAPDLQELEGAVLRQEPWLGWIPPTRRGAAIPPFPGPEMSVSGALSRLVRDKFARLPTGAVTTLRLAALLGPAVDPALLLEGTGLSAPEVDHALRIGEAAGLLHDAGAGGVRWGSAEVAAAVVAMLDAGDRRALHAKAAQALEAAYGEAALAEAVRHLVAAGSAVPAGRVCAVGHLAAESYLRNGNADRAVEVCQQVLVAVGDDAPAGPRVDVAICLARAQALQGRVELAEETWRAAVRTARDLADPERFGLSVLSHEWARRTMISPGPDRSLLHDALALVGPQPSALRVRLASALIGEAAITGEIGGLVDLVEQTLSTAEAVGDQLAQVTALHAQHVLLRATPHLAERRSVAGRLEGATAFLQDPYWDGVARLARTYDECVRGHGVAVPALVKALGDDVERSQSPRLRWHLLLTQSSTLRLRGEYAAADRCAEQALVLGVSAGVADAVPAALVHRYLTDLETTTVAHLLPLVEPYCRENPGVLLGHSALALAALHADRRTLAARAADRALSLAAALPWEERTLLSLALVAATELGLSRIDHVEHVARQLAPYGGQFIVFGQVTGTCGPVDRLLGLAAAMAGDLECGHTLLQGAEDQSRQAGWAPWRVRCATDRVELLRRWGRRAEAKQLARQTHPSAVALGMTTCVDTLVS